MRKTFALFIVVLALFTFSVHAEGEMGSTRSCTQGQTCLVAAEPANETSEKNGTTWYLVIWKSVFKLFN